MRNEQELYIKRGQDQGFVPPFEIKPNGRIVFSDPRHNIVREGGAKKMKKDGKRRKGNR